MAANNGGTLKNDKLYQTMATFGVLPMVKSVNLPVVLLVPFLPMVTRKHLTISAANGTIGTNGTIGRSHGGIFIILINAPHLFLSFLFIPCISCCL